MARSKEFSPEEKLEKARDLFWEKGYHATSMQDLVEAMGLNRGSIYDTYGDKHSLFLQCLTLYAEAGAYTYRKEAVASASPMKAVENIINKGVDWILGQGKSCMAVKTSFELAPVDSDAHAIIKRNAEQMTAILEDLLIQAQKMGELAPHKDPQLLAQFISSNFSGFWQTHILYGNVKQVKRLAQFLIQTIKS